MEPFTILQRMAEIMEYTEHLDTAAVTEDQYDRCATHERVMGAEVHNDKGWRKGRRKLSSLEIVLDHAVASGCTVMQQTVAYFTGEPGRIDCK